MGYKRASATQQLPEGQNLTAAMVGIGMNFAARGTPNQNIENTILAASIEGMEHDDLRVLSVLVTWLNVHHPWINADRLLRGARFIESHRVRGFWTAFGRSLYKKDRRFARFTQLYKGPRIALLRTGNDFQIERRGEDERFAGSSLRVPQGTLRDRPADVLSPAQLAKRHKGYRQRILMGPSYRADMWAALEQNPEQSPAELARSTYGSFATAWQIKHDWALLRGA